MNNQELLNFRKKHFLPTAIHYHKEALQLTKAEGIFVWDEQGRQYIDAIGGVVCISAGHNHPKIKAELQKMLEQNQIQHTSLLYLSEHVVQAASELIKEAPDDLDRVQFVNSGSEANELAFMASRNATKESIVVNLRHSYHGGTAATLANCGHHTWKFGSQPGANTTSALEPYCYRCPFGKTESSCNLECAKNVETTIQTSTHGKIAAFIAEPVMGVGGFIAPRKEYFQEVEKIVHNYGGKYISDEVQTGAGRTGQEFFLTKELGIQADAITMAKGLGNGTAIGAVLMKSDLAEPMSGKLYFNTFGGDPYATMQAKLTIQTIREENLIPNAKEMGNMLMQGLKELQKDYPCMGDVRGRGLMIAIEFVKDPKTKEHGTEECARFMDLCKDEGLLVGKGGLRGNVIRITPPLSIQKQEVEEVLKRIERALAMLEA